LPERVNTEKLWKKAIAAKIAFVPGDLFSPGRLYRNCLRLNCGNPWSDATEATIKRLGELAAGA
jgi:DNA-binding transcriptional MocR family regulator